MNPKTVSCTSVIDRFDSDLWHFHAMIPSDVVTHFHSAGIKRLVCEINGSLQIHCAFMPAGDDRYFINLNKEVRTKLKLNPGDPVTLQFREDTSKYGMPLTEEFEAVIATDEEGNRLFHALTPGKQRSLIYLVTKLKNSDKRIEKSLIILDHLKANNGTLDFKQLNEAFKMGYSG